jgi:hypothetical protein
MKKNTETEPSLAVERGTKAACRIMLASDNSNVVKDALKQFGIKIVRVV